MNGYTVTITTAGDESGPQTTIQVDTSSGAARVVELTVRAANGAGIAPQQLPAFDLAGLIAALAPNGTPAITSTATPAETPVAEATPAAEPEPEAPVRRPRATRTPRATGERRGRSRAAEAAPRKRGRRSSEESTEPKKAGRAYRRMPDPNEVIDAYQQSGRVTAVAEHFGVPRHTATGWLRRLRRMGLLATAGDEG